jgi:hypothetical protein
MADNTISEIERHLNEWRAKRITAIKKGDHNPRLVSNIKEADQMVRAHEDALRDAKAAQHAEM